MSPRRAPALDLDNILDQLRTGAPAEEEDRATTAMMDATTGLLTIYGMRRWTIDDVAERAGLGRATVYRKFKSRDELVQATLIRDARLFFASIAHAVEGIDGIESKLVEGFLVGLRLARSLPIPAGALPLVTDGKALAAGRDALVERYVALAPRRLSPAERRQAHLVAEVLMRLAVSFLLVPDSVIDPGDERSARAAIRRLVVPLLAGGG